MALSWSIATREVAKQCNPNSVKMLPQPFQWHKPMLTKRLFWFLQICVQFNLREISRDKIKHMQGIFFVLAKSSWTSSRCSRGDILYVYLLLWLQIPLCWPQHVPAPGLHFLWWQIVYLVSICQFLIFFLTKWVLHCMDLWLCSMRKWYRWREELWMMLHHSTYLRTVARMRKLKSTLFCLCCWSYLTLRLDDNLYSICKGISAITFAANHNSLLESLSPEQVDVAENKSKGSWRDTKGILMTH